VGLEEWRRRVAADPTNPMAPLLALFPEDGSLPAELMQPYYLSIETRRALADLQGACPPVNAELLSLYLKS
jgi:hypothetical protein